MASDRPFKQIDVFSSKPLLGNPVAVLLDGVGLDDSEMQAIAAWTNLSETTFVFPPTEDADYAVRIFTPNSELPFAGHPTIGTAFALLDAGLVKPTSGRLRQQCPKGVINLSIADNWRKDGLAFELPPYQFREIPDGGIEAIASLGSNLDVVGTPLSVDVGAVWLIIELSSAAQLASINPDRPRILALSTELGLTGITTFAKTPGEDHDILVRTFAPAVGISEDPVCGSGNGAVAAYRLHRGDLGEGDRYHASQGRQVGRDGRISVAITDGQIFVGGPSVTTINGSIRTPATKAVAAQPERTAA